MNKPLIIALNEAKTELASVINKMIQQDNLPCYLIEPMLSEFLYQIKDGAKNEMQMAIDQMNMVEQDEEQQEG